MRYAQRVAYSVAVQVVGRGVMLGVAVATLRSVTALLGPEGYGGFAIATLLAGLAATIGDLGLGLFAMRELSAAADAPARATLLRTLVGLRLATAIPFLAVGPLVAVLVPGYGPGVAAATLGLAVAQLAALVQQLGVADFQARMRWDVAVACEAAGRIATWVLLVLGHERWAARDSLAAVVGCVLAGAVVAFACTAAGLAATGGSLRPRWPKGRALSLLARAWPLGAFGILGLVHFRIDAFVLSLLRPAVEVGLYGVAAKILEIGVLFAPMFAGVVLPRFVVLARDGATAESALLFDRALRAILVLALPAAWFTATHAPALVRLVQGRAGFEPAAAPLAVLAGAMPALFVSALAGMLVVALGRQRAVVAPLAGITLLNAGLNAALVPAYSFRASAWITVGTESLLAIAFFACVRDVVRPAQVARTLLHGAACLGIAAAVVAGVRRLLGAATMPDAGPVGTQLAALVATAAVCVAGFAAVAFAARFVRVAEIRALVSRAS